MNVNKSMSFLAFLPKLKVLIPKKQLTRGIIAYSVLWPTSSIIQQTIEGRNFETYDWKRCIRFSLFGGLFVAPTLYGWIKFSSVMWPKTNLKSGISKALVEQVSYGPFAMTCFYMGMGLLEFKGIKESFEELKTKFIPTYKVAICFWPIMQTINFSLIPERNRVVFVSLCSVLWTTFLAYMKQLEIKELKETKEETILIFKTK